MLQKRISKGRDERAKFVSSQIDKGIAYQIRALRDRQDLSQEELAEAVGMNQNAISRLESPRYGRPTIRTLKRLAAAFDVALVVRFVPFSQLVKWVSGTLFVDHGLSTESLAAASFEEDVFANETVVIDAFAGINLLEIPINTQGNRTLGPSFVLNLGSPYPSVIQGGENLVLVTTTATHTPPSALEKTPEIPYRFIAAPAVEHPSLSPI
jgi:transcriptional regulator with XRE-family HTH domain